MSISFQASLVIVILLALFSIAASIFIYRYTVPIVSPLKKWILITLRASAFTLTLLALCEPLFQITTKRNELPMLTVLVDNSLSMSQTDKTGNREVLTKSLLKKDSFNRLSSAATLVQRKFSYSLSPLVVDSFAMDGGSTNISSALQTTIKESPSGLQSILLITDGNYNDGSNPLYIAEQSPVPIFTVGVGDTTDQIDVMVSKVVANSIGYVDASIPVDVTIKSSGIGAVPVRVSLVEDGKVIEEKNITLPPSNGSVAVTPVQFTYLPKTEGVKKLTVRVSGVKEEITPKNNARSTLIKILKNKMSIVVIAGALSPDVATIMQTLHGDKNLNAFLYYQLPDGGFKSQLNSPPLAQSLLLADCIVLCGFPVSYTPISELQTIIKTVESKSTSVLFVASRTIDLQMLKQCESILPVSVISFRNDEQVVFPNVPLQHKYHALVQMDAQRFPLFSWEKLPPMYASFQSFAAKPEAQTLLTVKIQGVAMQNPLLVSRSVAGKKSLALLGYGINRWKLLASSGDETKGVFDSWFSSVIRWLTLRDQEKQLQVEPLKEFFSQGEPVEFSAQVYNENYQPVDNAELQIHIISKQQMKSEIGNRSENIVFKSIGTGRYEATAEGMSQGEYEFRAAALVNNDTIGTTSGRFSVGEQTIEFAETKMNKSLLKQIANVSGGLYCDIAQFDSLAAKIISRPEMKPIEKIQTSEFELWNLPAYLSIIIILFAVEWFIRKQSGML